MDYQMKSKGLGKIHDATMLRMVNKGIAQVEVARFFDVSRAAVCKRLKELTRKSTAVTVSKKIEKVTDTQIDAIQQLTLINKRTHDLLDEAEGDTGTALKVIAEIRQQLRLQVDIFETLFNLQAANLPRTSVCVHARRGSSR